jgi:hypothetical protein
VERFPISEREEILRRGKRCQKMSNKKCSVARRREGREGRVKEEEQKEKKEEKCYPKSSEQPHDLNEQIERIGRVLHDFAILFHICRTKDCCFERLIKRRFLHRDVDLQQGEE